jgi:hypothetical protein
MRRQRITAAAVAGALARCDVLLAICPLTRFVGCSLEPSVVRGVVFCAERGAVMNAEEGSLTLPV